jgi:hypothetical protein
MNFESLYKPEQAAALQGRGLLGKDVGPDCGSKSPMECERMKREWGVELQKQQEAQRPKIAVPDLAQGGRKGRFGHNFASIQVHEPPKEKPKVVAPAGKKEEKP